MYHKNYAFRLRPKGDFKLQGKKGGKKFWYYQFPTDSILIEKCDPEVSAIGFIPILKYEWQKKQAYSGIDTSKYLKDYHKLPISQKAIRTLESRIIEWYQKNKRHKYLVITYQELK